MDYRETSTTQNYDVYLVGRYFCDLVFTQLPELPRLGHEIYARQFHLVPGGVATPAIALTRLGVRVAWPCIYGSDVFSQYIKTYVEKENVDAALFSDSDQPSPHISVAFSYADERAFLSYVDALPDLPHAHLIRQTQPAWVYITNLQSGRKLNEMVRSAREIGARIIMDCQAHSERLPDARISEALRSVDVFSPNLDEARALTGEPDAERALAKLSEYTNTVIIKQGTQGCICQHEGSIMQIPAISANVKDTTGAGDNFNCGFLFGQLNGYSLADSLRAANICGGLSVQGFGGSSTSPTRREVKKLLEKDLPADR